MAISIAPTLPPRHSGPAVPIPSPTAPEGLQRADKEAQSLQTPPQFDITTFIDEHLTSPQETEGNLEDYSISTISLGTADELTATTAELPQQDGETHTHRTERRHLLRRAADESKVGQLIPDNTQIEDTQAVAAQTAKLIDLTQRAQTDTIEEVIAAIHTNSELSERDKLLLLRQIFVGDLLRTLKAKYSENHSEPKSPREALVVYIGSAVSENSGDSTHIADRHSDLDWVTPTATTSDINQAILRASREAYPRDADGTELRLSAHLISQISPTAHIGFGTGVRSIGFSISERDPNGHRQNKLADSLMSAHRQEDTPTETAATALISNFFFVHGEQRTALVCDWDGEQMRYSIINLSHKEPVQEQLPKLRLRTWFAEGQPMYETDWEQIVKHLRRSFTSIDDLQQQNPPIPQLTELIDPAVLLKCRLDIANLPPYYRATDFAPQERVFVASVRAEMCNYLLDFCHLAGETAEYIVQAAGLDPSDYEDLEQARTLLQQQNSAAAQRALNRLHILEKTIEIMGIPQLYNVQLYATPIDKGDLDPWVTTFSRDEEKRLTTTAGGSNAYPLPHHTRGTSTLEMISPSHITHLRQKTEEIFIG